jgi:hypothetical protein
MTVEFINISDDIKLVLNNWEYFNKCSLKCKTCKYIILWDELINHMICSFEFNDENWYCEQMGRCGVYQPKVII